MKQFAVFVTETRSVFGLKHYERLGAAQIAELAKLKLNLPLCYRPRFSWSLALRHML